MDDRPIGVFDSGLGGLTAVREIRSILPFENIIYFGDTSRVPYGGRSQEILLKYARQDIHFLRSFDIKALLVACGTVSTTALPTLRWASSFRLAPRLMLTKAQQPSPIITAIASATTVRGKTTVLAALP